MACVSPKTSLKIIGKVSKFDINMDEWGYDTMGEIDFNFDHYESELRNQIITHSSIKKLKRPTIIGMILPLVANWVF